MIKAESKIYPDSIWLRKTETGKAYLRLRDNIEEVERETEDEEKETIYEYDEVEVVVANRQNLMDYVENNFSDLFELGKEQMAKVEKTSEEKIEELEGWQKLQDEELEAIIETLEEE